MKMLNRRSLVLIDMIRKTCSSKGKFGVRREDDAVSVRIYSEQKKLASGVPSSSSQALLAAAAAAAAALAPGGSEETEPDTKIAPYIVGMTTYKTY